MQIFSHTHSIVATAAAALRDRYLASMKDDSGFSPPHSHAPGTLLELPEPDAQDLVERRLAVAYDPIEHGNDPRTLIRRSVPFAEYPDERLEGHGPRRIGAL